MDLNTVWFILIAVLFTGYFFLEGFDYGVGILLPFLGKDEEERGRIIATIGPHWDANEVWLITAGGAMFAAFPNWYATMFSGFYLALLLMLVALILRGIAIEFRNKDTHPRWRSTWDWLIFVGSLIPPILWGVAMGNLLIGTPINADMTYIGGFWNLLNPYALVCGLAFLAIFSLHGATFLSLKLNEPILDRAFTAARRVWPIALIAGVLALGVGYFVTDMYERLGVNPGLVPIIAGAAMLAAGWFIRKKQGGWAFAMSGIGIVFSTVTFFVGLFPRLMVSNLSPEWSLTIYNASSSPYTLKVMTIIAAIFIPLVLLYQGWSYYVFRARVTRDSKLEY
jgi:cytochrome d ubiquinol oxidase subunit II